MWIIEARTATSGWIRVGVIDGHVAYGTGIRRFSSEQEARRWVETANLAGAPAPLQIRYRFVAD